MKIFSTLLVLLGILASSFAYSAVNQFVHCDSCTANKAKVTAALSGYTGNVTVGDIETGYIASFNVIETQRFGEYFSTATATTTSTYMASQFDKVYVLYQNAKNDHYETTGIIESPWEALQSPYLGNRVIAQVIRNHGAPLTQKAVNFFNEAATLTGAFKPLDIYITTPDGGFLVFAVTGTGTDGVDTFIVGDFNFARSEDGNGNPITGIKPGKEYGFSGSSDPAYIDFTSYMAGLYGWTWNSNTDGGSGSGGGASMTCYKTAGGNICVIKWLN